jgi:hypothetical protein
MNSKKPSLSAALRDATRAAAAAVVEPVNGDDQTSATAKRSARQGLKPIGGSPKSGQNVPWKSLQKQLGCDYANPRHFKAAAKLAVRKVQTVFPGFRVNEYDDANGGGLFVKKGATAVKRRIAAAKTDKKNDLRKLSTPKRRRLPASLTRRFHLRLSNQSFVPIDWARYLSVSSGG